VRVLPDTPDSTPISNTNYRIATAGGAQTTGSPVQVIVSRNPPPRQVWLPLVVR
jgi:hypothetical protein